MLGSVKLYQNPKSTSIWFINSHAELTNCLHKNVCLLATSCWGLWVSVVRGGARSARWIFGNSASCLVTNIAQASDPVWGSWAKNFLEEKDNVSFIWSACVRNEDYAAKAILAQDFSSAPPAAVTCHRGVKNMVVGSEVGTSWSQTGSPPPSILVIMSN